MDAANTAVGSTLYNSPVRARTTRASSSTSVREWTSTPATLIGAPNVVNDRDRYPTAYRTISAISRPNGTLPSFDALMREDVVLEHEVVGDRHRNDDQIGRSALSAALNSPVFAAFSSPL
jgi:hypothetical protein